MTRCNSGDIRWTTLASALNKGGLRLPPSHNPVQVKNALTLSLIGQRLSPLPTRLPSMGKAGGRRGRSILERVAHDDHVLALRAGAEEGDGRADQLLDTADV